MKKFFALLVALLLAFGSCAAAEAVENYRGVQFALPDGFALSTDTYHYRTYGYSDGIIDKSAALACTDLLSDDAYLDVPEETVLDMITTSFDGVQKVEKRMAGDHLVAYIEMTYEGESKTYIIAFGDQLVVMLDLQFHDTDRVDLQNALAHQIYESVLYTGEPSISSSADAFDFSGLSLAELAELQSRITLAMFETGEWQEVEVPQGVYKIGEDIPAGKWTIQPVNGGHTYVYWGDMLKPSGLSLSGSGKIYEYANLYSKTHEWYRTDDRTEITFDMQDGQYFIVDMGVAVFTPYAGAPKLNFK